MTPQATSPSELPQAFGIQVAASQVQGFSQAVATFELVIESHLFAFGNSLQIINATAGQFVSFIGLQNDLTLDGQPARPSEVSHVVMDAPSWLSISNSTLTISGTIPENAIQQNFTVTATDKYGDSASTVVLIETAGNKSVNLISPIAALSATVGTNFVYAINATLASVDGLNITVDPGTASAWLGFNSSSYTLYGHVPNNLKPQTVQFNLTATQGSQSQSQIVDIDIGCGSAPCAATTSLGVAPKATASMGTALGSKGIGSKGWVAAAVILPLAAIAGLLMMLCCCCRRGRNMRSEMKPKRTIKAIISRPIRDEKEDHVETQAGAVEDPESSEYSSSVRTSKAPTIPETWLAALINKRSSMFRLSKATNQSAEQSPRPHSWQSYVRTLEPIRPKYPVSVKEFSLIPEEQTPQKEEEDNYYAHVSRSLLPFDSVQPSHPQRLSKQRERVSKLSFGNGGMFSLRPVSGFGHGRSGPSQASNNMGFGSRGVGHGHGGVQGGPKGWGTIRSSWRNLSRISWTSTQSPANSNDPIVEEGVERPPTQKSFASMLSLFPRPSTSTTADMSRRPHIIHEASDDDEPHRVQQVKPLPRSHPNPRSPSSIRRGSAGNGPLQEFHKRRLQERTGRNPLFSAHLSSSREPSLPERQRNGNLVLEPPTPEKGMITRSYSQSSSLEPPSFTTSPAGSSELTPSPRKKSHINYHFTTRAISPLRRNRSSYASSIGSSKFSDPVGVAPFYPSAALQEDNNDVGHKLWLHANHPNPLGTNRSDTKNSNDVSDSELINSLRAAGQFSAAQRLEYLRAQTAGGRTDDLGESIAVEVRSARGKRLNHNVGLRPGDPGNTSMKGEIRDAGESAFM